MDKINILGTEYELNYKTENEDNCLIGKAGYCDFYAKKIVLKNDFNENDPNVTGDVQAFKNETFRHEVIHAFLFESGLYDESHDERLVNYLATQLPKMFDVMQELDLINKVGD